MSSESASPSSSCSFIAVEALAVDDDRLDRMWLARKSYDFIESHVNLGILTQQTISTILNAL